MRGLERIGVLLKPRPPQQILVGLPSLESVSTMAANDRLDVASKVKTFGGHNRLLTPTQSRETTTSNALKDRVLLVQDFKFKLGSANRGVAEFPGISKATIYLHKNFHDQNTVRQNRPILIPKSKQKSVVSSNSTSIASTSASKSCRNLSHLLSIFIKMTLGGPETAFPSSPYCSW